MRQIIWRNNRASLLLFTYIEYLLNLHYVIRFHAIMEEDAMNFQINITHTLQFHCYFYGLI